MTVEWRYLDRRNVAHAVHHRHGARDQARLRAPNRRGGSRRGWLGAQRGNGAEAVRAAGMPRCRRCVRLLAADEQVAS